ncbi:hypothetical protein [Chryseobacterium sp. Mn2064]|uniref:hypothetical protein n=1 Tax=Chryseobacterium sp. Mn2064 TaxID=3395263 RepID=UPI003BC455F2
MKENLKKTRIFNLLLILLISYGCTAQTFEKKELYNYLDTKISSKKFLYLKISLIKKCKDEYLFGIATMNYNDHLSNKFKTYDYKGSLIIYDLGEENDIRIINFFNSYFKETNLSISNIPKGRQSLVNEYALYFVNKSFVKDIDKTKIFMITDCENK